MSDPRDSVEQRLRPLWLAAQAGDEAAYRKSLELMSQRLRAYFRRRMSDAPHDLEDLVQESLLAIHLKRETYDTSQSFTPWAFAIARHKLIDWFRRHGGGDRAMQARINAALRAYMADHDDGE